MKTRLLLTLMALALASQARAQTVDISFASAAAPAETSPYSINSLWQVRLDYNLPTATYSGTTLEVTLPDAASYGIVSVLTAAAPNAWTQANAYISPTQRKYTFTLADVPSAQTISGAIILTVRADSANYIDNTRYFVKSGTNLPFVARLRGTRDGTTQFDVSDTDSQQVVGQPDPHWQLPLVPYGLMNDRIDGHDVYLVRYDLRAFVCGNGPINGPDTGGPGLEIRVNLGSKLHFLRAWWGDNSGNWPTDDRTGQGGSVEETPFAYGEVGHTTGGHILASWDRTLAPDYAGNCDYTRNFYVDIVYVCDEGWNENDPDYQMQAVDQTNQALPIQGYRVDADGSMHAYPLPAITSTNAYGANACGGQLKVEKRSDAKASPASDVTWNFFTQLPIGRLPGPGTIVVDRLPTDTTLPAGTMVLKPVAGLAATTVWFCDLHAESPAVAYFDDAAFQSYKTAGKCLAGVNHPLYSNWWVPPPVMTALTHLVFAFPDDLSLAEDGVPIYSQFFVGTYVPATQASDYTNCVQLVGSVGGTTYGDTSLEPAGTPDPVSNDDVAEDCATKTIPSFACPRLEFVRDTVEVMSPGSCGAFRYRMLKHQDGLAPTNPTFSIDLPAGIIVKDVPGRYIDTDGDGFSGVCTDGTGLTDALVTLDPSPPGDGVTAYTSPRTVTAHVQRASPKCAIGTYGFNYQLEFCVDTQRPFADGDALAFTSHVVAADNLGTEAQCAALTGNDPAYARAQTLSFALSVPPEMRSFVAPVCQQDGQGAAFVVDGVNTGGVALPSASLAFEIPSGATFAGVEDVVRPSGSFYQVSSDGIGWAGAGAIADGLVRYVRLTGVTLPPVSDNRMAFRVLVSGGGALVGRSALTVDPSVISEPALGVGTFEGGSCTPVTIGKYADLDGDGKRGVGEPALSGWQFTITTSEGGFVAAGASGADGTWTTVLPEGDYVATEVLPVPSGDAPRWDPTGAVTWAFSVEVNGGALVHAFGNDCACDEVDEDLCTTRDCVRNGGGASASPADFACGPEREIDCDGNVCTSDDCDPDVGCVEGTFTPCTPMVYFLPARDTTTNTLVAFRCEVPTDGTSPPACDTNPDGTLRPYADQGGACGGGGAPSE